MRGVWHSGHASGYLNGVVRSISARSTLQPLQRGAALALDV